MSLAEPFAGARRLAAILAADVAGYSRLMGADEEGTLARLKGHRRELVDPKIRDHRGRIVKTTGDGMLVEFASVVDAVRCAVEIQRAMLDREAEVDEDRRIRFRIGINLGDIIADGDDIFGDGVNVAARLEALAEPGGVCVSRTVRNQVRDRLPYSFEDLGEQSVKNIARPVRADAMRADAVAVTPLVPLQPQAYALHQRRNFHPVVIATIVITVAGMGLAGWLWSDRGLRPLSTSIETAAIASAPAKPAPRLSIVVLPFANLSNDLEQEYFVDAITDDLTTDLSRIAGSLVIARTTAFTYKGKAVDVKQIGRDLGVRYVLEGSVRRLGDQVQVNVQLIDAQNGAHTWADRFETDRTNLAKAQDEITARLARSLQLELIEAASHEIERDKPVDLDARDLVMRGWAIWYRGASRSNLEEAQRVFDHALEIDPSSNDGKIGSALILAMKVDAGFSDSVQQDEDRAEQLLAEALERDPNRSMAHTAMGVLRRAEDRLAEAQAELETAITLDRNNAFAFFLMGSVLMRGGQPQPCIAFVEKALRLSPRETLPYAQLGKCQLFLGHIDDALNFFRRAEAGNPGVWWVHLKLAGTLGLMGNIEEAKAEAAEMVRLNPKMNSVTRIRVLKWYRNPQFQALHDKTIIQGLRNIGFPEETASQPRTVAQ
jgi:class 3 adenylate cyclase/TolB-like protein